MEGVGARLGRSSSRYGTTTVFSGPVRKWKKKWVHVTPSSSPNNNSNAASNSSHIHHTLSNGTTNGNNGSHLVLYKWTPISQSNNNNNSSSNNEHNSGNEDKNSTENDAVSAAEEPPRRKFKYIPIALLDEEQKKETEENTDDEANNTDADTMEPTSKNSGPNVKPDINDVPMEESQDPEQNQIASGRQDLNVSTLDLSLGLTSHDGDRDSNSKTDQNKDGQSKE